MSVRIVHVLSILSFVTALSPDQNPADARTLKAVAIALPTTLSAQAMVAFAGLTVPVFAPAAAKVIGVAPSLIGLYASTIFIGAMITSLLSGGFVQRYGAIRVTQFALLAAAVGLSLVTTAKLPLIVLGAFVIGFAYGPLTPASSHLLAKRTPLRLMSFVFSLKQTSVPLGGALAGALVPGLVIAFGWKGAGLSVALLCAIGAVVIQPTRPRLDADRTAGERLFPGSPFAPIRFVVGHRGLRDLAIASFIFSGTQQCLGVFLVADLVTHLGLPLVQAGAALATTQVAGIVGRILWGGTADRFGHSRALLGLLGAVMAGSAVAVALFAPGIPFGLIIAVAIVFGGSAVGWNGVFLAEIARLAPEGQISRATGGVLFFTFGGVVVVPTGFTLLTVLFGGYASGFIAVAVLTGSIGAYLIRPVPVTYRPS